MLEPMWDIASRVWLVKPARPFVVFEIALAAILFFGWIIYVANVAVGPLPVYPEVVNWTYFGWAVVISIAVLIFLAAVLLLIALVSNPPSPKEEGSNKPALPRWVGPMAGVCIALILIGFGALIGRPILFSVLGLMIAVALGVPMREVLMGKRKKKE